MKTIILAELAILVVASGCGSARGAAPDPGGTCTCPSPSRQEVKCYTQTMPNDPGITGVTTQCLNADDVPLTGHCSRPGVGPEVLKTDGPAGWDIPAAPAMWSCGWMGSNGGGGYKYVNIPGATATICCLVKSQ